MLNQNSEEFKAYFLIEFTRELIRNSADIEMYKLVKLVQQEENEKIGLVKKELEQKTKNVLNEKKEIKKFVKDRIKQKDEYINSVKREVEGEGENPFKTRLASGDIKRTLSPNRPQVMQEPPLPETLKYLTPLPVPGEIDLGKINNLVQDPVVRVIECNGPGKEVIIGGVMGTKETSIILSKDEIEKIIKKFSEETKIPLEEGFFKVASGKLVISAIYSESVGSKFIIKKIVATPQGNPLMPSRNNVYPTRRTR